MAATVGATIFSSLTLATGGHRPVAGLVVIVAWRASEAALKNVQHAAPY